MSRSGERKKAFVHFSGKEFLQSLGPGWRRAAQFLLLAMNRPEATGQRDEIQDLHEKFIGGFYEGRRKETGL